MAQRRYAGDLAILNEVLGNRARNYRSASWLVSPYESACWETKISRTIDFSIRLNDGLLLTDGKHGELLDTIKAWICLQSHPDSSNGRLLPLATVRQKISFALTLIDYLLLNSTAIGLESYGLKSITASDLNSLLHALASAKHIHVSIYRWPERLSRFLLEASRDLTEFEMEDTVREYPPLALQTSHGLSRTIPLSDEAIRKARIWLYRNGYYTSVSTHRAERSRSPRLNAIAKQIYANTLLKPHTMSIPWELRLGVGQNRAREHYGAPVKTPNEHRMKAIPFAAYVNVLRSMALLESEGFAVPAQSLRDMSARCVARQLGLGTSGRFTNLPQEVVLESLRHSVEFALKYGDELVDSYIRIRIAAKSACMSISALFSNRDIKEFLSNGLIGLGVEIWSVNTRSRGHGFRADLSEYRTNRCSLIRSNIGLWDLLIVLYGAVAVCVGTLMARRSGELLDLVVGRCLDKTNNYLVFENRKTGFIGKRQREVRPIPSIGVRMISLLERLQYSLIEYGLLAQPTHLFAVPTERDVALSSASLSSLYMCIDRFSDYFQTPLNEAGERYYIRPHQLRRFFAMLFFWGRSFGGMDTLRWFLGHANLEHLYHYITEETPGAVLSAVKVEYAASLLKANDADAQDLANLLYGHFHTRNFSVLDDQELNEYIEELMASGAVEIEPHFISTADGQDFRIHIVVKPGGRP